jgi:hypothetical protein
VDVNNVPSPTATHNEVLGQLMELSSGVVGSALLILVVVHAPGPPDGSVDVRTSPLLSTAAQKLVERQSTSVIPGPVVSTGCGLQGGSLAPGSVVIQSWPLLTATHSDADAQVTALPKPAVARCHCDEPPVGSTDVYRFGVDPLTPAVATQSVADQQEIALNSPDTGLGMLAAFQAEAPPAGSVEYITSVEPKSARQ